MRDALFVYILMLFTTGKLAIGFLRKTNENENLQLIVSLYIVCRKAA